MIDQSGMPFDDVRRLVAGIEPLDAPCWVIDGQGSPVLQPGNPQEGGPDAGQSMLVLFAGSHEIDVQTGAKNSPAWIMEQVREICAGNAEINRECEKAGCGFKVFDLAVEMPVADISSRAAMDEKTCAGTLAFGMEAIAGGGRLLLLGAVVNQVDLSNLLLVQSLGIAMDEAKLLRSQPVPVASKELMQEVRSLHLAKGRDGLEMLRRLGGRETAAIVGAILAARTQGIPVLVESIAGFAAVSVLHSLNPLAVEHCLLAGSRFEVDPVASGLDLPMIAVDERFRSYGEAVLEVSRQIVGGCVN